MARTWSKIKGFPNYSISDKGDVRNDLTNKEKAQVVSRDGYKKVDLYRCGERVTTRVHRLVGEAFIDNPMGKPQINHKDGNKLNNNVENLEWVTCSENMKHSFYTGLHKPNMGMVGKKNPNAGRPGKKIRIIETGEIFDSITECEKYLNGNGRHISDCLNGRQNTHRGYHFEYVFS